MHLGNQLLRPQEKTKDTNTIVLVRIAGGTKVRVVLRLTIKTGRVVTQGGGGVSPTVLLKHF